MGAGGLSRDLCEADVMRFAPAGQAPASGERGVLLAFVSILLAVVVVGCLLIAGVANSAADRAAAQSVADAAALAGAADGRASASRIAAANDATIESFDRDGEVVTVTIRRAGVRAIASADRQIRPLG